MFDPVWETVHASRPWEIEPNEELKSIVTSLYGDAPDKSEILFLGLGCGTGASALWLAKQGYSVVAVDGSRSAIERLMVYRSDAGISEELLRVGSADITSPEFSCEPVFDCIIDVYSIESLSDTDAKQTIARARDWLKPGGIIVSMMAAGFWDMPADCMPGVPHPRLVDSLDWVTEAFQGYRWACGKRLIKLINNPGSYHSWCIVGEKPGENFDGSRAIAAERAHYRTGKMETMPA